MGDKVGAPPATQDRAGGADAPEPATQSQPSGRSSTGADENVSYVMGIRDLVAMPHVPRHLGVVLLDCATEIERQTALKHELLAALKHILGGALSLPRFAEEEARAAIAKAEGR